MYNSTLRFIELNPFPEHQLKILNKESIDRLAKPSCAKSYAASLHPCDDVAKTLYFDSKVCMGHPLSEHR